jgi:hypothetical protein
MDQLTKLAVVGTGTVLAGWIAWGVYIRRSTEQIPYEQVQTLDGVEIRRYSQTILVETTADSERTAFRRLLSYLKGANTGGDSVEMTAPVESNGDSVEMTAPVESDSDGDETHLAFYLPEAYDSETAPEPTDDAVELRVESPKTMAVRRFSWFTPDWRVARQEQKLLSTLDSAGIDPRGEPTLLRYNDPRTPPFMRRNEVAVEIPEEAVAAD